MPGLDEVLAAAAVLIGDLVLRDTVRITRPSLSKPTLNTTTGELEYPAAAVIYEGPGAVQADSQQAGFNGWPTAGEPWVTETKSMSRALTPLEAPFAAKDDLFSVIAVHDPANTALMGRFWIATDVARANTLEAVRITPLDQKQAARGGGAP